MKKKGSINLCRKNKNNDRKTKNRKNIRADHSEIANFV